MLSRPKLDIDMPSITHNSVTSSHGNSIISEPESSLTSDTDNVSSPHTISGSNLTNSDSNIFAYCNDSFNCLVINFQSIRNKRTDLYNIISSMEPEVIIGDETHLDATYLDAEILPYDIPNEHKYKIYRKDRKTLVDKGGGGVVIMVKPHYDCEECPDLDTACELKWIKLTTHKKESILVGAFYREPKSTMEALEQLDLSISRIFKSNKYRNCKIFLGGDFNLGDIDWHSGCVPTGARDKAYCEKLISILNCHNLEQVNTLSTRQDRTLDLFITSHPSLVQKYFTCPPVGLSDHDILAVRTYVRPSRPTKTTRTVYNYKKANWEKAKEEMKEICNSFLSEDRTTYSVEQNWTFLKNQYLK